MQIAHRMLYCFSTAVVWDKTQVTLRVISHFLVSFEIIFISICWLVVQDAGMFILIQHCCYLRQESGSFMSNFSSYCLIWNYLNQFADLLNLQDARNIFSSNDTSIFIQKKLFTSLWMDEFLVLDFIIETFKILKQLQVQQYIK